MDRQYKIIYTNDIADGIRQLDEMNKTLMELHSDCDNMPFFWGFEFYSVQTNQMLVMRRLY